MAIPSKKHIRTTLGSLRVRCEVLDFLDTCAEPVTPGEIAGVLRIPCAQVEDALMLLIETAEVFRAKLPAVKHSRDGKGRSYTSLRYSTTPIAAASSRQSLSLQDQESHA